ncbi:ABC transporter substrate-binding protein [Desulfoluna sp.]|uniref:ABC transporter substrate-binding protein n=1 Tax=Desulfoluna sp. TaxID=2045199 RepID=UPI0026249681|nr:ABC transporter substrate-binding protein [Desulfoluna sp.]
MPGKSTLPMILTLVWLVTALQGAPCLAEPQRTVVDSRGIQVSIPSEIKRVATVSDGLVEGVMTALGVQETLVAVGSSCLQRHFKYSFPSVSGQNFSCQDGMNPVLRLNPWIKDLPRVAKSGTPINYEALVKADPEVVIVRIGSCTLRYEGDETATKTIEMVEALGFPVVVIHGTNCGKAPSVSGISEEIRIVGEVFNKRAKAFELAGYLQAQVAMIQERTQSIPEEEKPTTLVFGPSPRARKAGGAGQVFGLNTIEAHFVEEIVHARNAFRESGYFKKINAEQLLALNPDVIVLCTASGYHPPRELYEAPYYQNLQDLSAVKNRRVAALPWSPCNCSKRLEYPIDAMVIAKASYPKRFQDVNLADWLLDFYQHVYGVDTETAQGLRSAQWMDWTLKKASGGPAADETSGLIL